MGEIYLPKPNMMGAMQAGLSSARAIKRGGRGSGVSGGSSGGSTSMYDENGLTARDRKKMVKVAAEQERRKKKADLKASKAQTKLVKAQTEAVKEDNKVRQVNAMKEAAGVETRQEAKKRKRQENRMVEQESKSKETAFKQGEENLQQDIDSTVRNWAGVVQQDTYEGFYNAVQKKGASFAGILPQPDTVAGMDPEQFQQLKDEMQYTPDKKTSAYDPGRAWKPNPKRYSGRDAEGNKVNELVNSNDPKAIADAEARGLSLVTSGDLAAETENAKRGVVFASDIADEANKANSFLPLIDTMGNLLDGFDTGTFAEGLGKAQGVLDAMGLQTEGYSQKQAFESFSNRMAIMAKNQGNGMIMTGAMSERDVKFLQAMVPGLQKSVKGNRLLLKIMRRMSKRQLNVNQMAIDYMRGNNGTMDKNDFVAHVGRELGAKPFFGLPEGAELKGYSKKTGRAIFEANGARYEVGE